MREYEFLSHPVCRPGGYLSPTVDGTEALSELPANTCSPKLAAIREADDRLLQGSVEFPIPQ